MKTDLAFSLGPNCRNTWNLRKQLGVEASYPFDWWITPARSMLKMIEPGFVFHATRDDLAITPTHEHNTVYNTRLNLLHHHDFTREWGSNGEYPGVIFRISEQEFDDLNAKYKRRFERLFADVATARHPLAVLNGSFEGWSGEYKGIPTNPELNGFISYADLAHEIRARLGRKVRVAFIEVGGLADEEHEWGWVVSRPDDGHRPDPDVPDYAEPATTFAAAYDWLIPRLPA